jgi:DNA-binding NarL/FixJ family response regulator
MDSAVLIEPGVSCLLVDDNRALLGALSALLRDAGVDVAGTAETGVAALTFLQGEPVRVILTDLRLPDFGGVDLARRSVEIARRKTAVIVYTSEADPGTLTEALDAGARGVVLKDASPEKLLQAISTVARGGTYVDPRLKRGPRRSHR